MSEAEFREQFHGRWIVKPTWWLPRFAVMTFKAFGWRVLWLSVGKNRFGIELQLGLRFTHESEGG